MAIGKVIPIKSNQMIERMREGGAILREGLRLIEQNIAEGVSTLRLDQIFNAHVVGKGAVPSFLGLYGFPASVCISIDDEVIHGIPSAHRKLQKGQLVSVDAGVFWGGLHTDAARTFIVGEADQQKSQLVSITRQCFMQALSKIRQGARVGDISHAVQSLAKEHGYGVVTKFVGHGVGEKLHEDPPVPNFGRMGSGALLKAGMTLAIEPMINLGSSDVYTDKDGWTVRTSDGKVSAHYENTVLVTESGFEVLTEQI